MVIFYKEFEVDRDPDNAEDEGRRRIARASHVFNASQVDGYSCPSTMPHAAQSVDRLGNVERFVAATGADIRFGGNRAF